MDWPAWSGVGVGRWKKSPDEEVRPPKTVWDLLQLLIVPAMLAAIAVLFNASEASRDRTRNENARRDATLDTYFGEMSSLMLNRHLLNAALDSPVRHVARTLTLTTVRRLDGERRGEVVRFLLEAGLLSQRNGQAVTPTIVGSGPRELRGPVAPPVDVDGADLRGADLRQVFMDHVSLAGSDLRGANFDDAQIWDVRLNATNLRGASFRSAYINGSRFSGSDLTGVAFDDAYFQQGDVFYAACLDHASFAGARFDSGVSFFGAEGRRVDFRDARNLSAIGVRGAVFTDARVDAGSHRPKGWGSRGTLHPGRERNLDPLLREACSLPFQTRQSLR